MRYVCLAFLVSLRPRAAQWVATVTSAFTELCTASCLFKHGKIGKRGPQVVQELDSSAVI